MKIQLEDLVKSHAGLAAHFGKAAGFHAAAHGVHAAHAAFAKAAGESMDDNDEHKQYFTKSAKAHEDLAELHKGMGEHCAGMAAGMQTKAAEPGTVQKTAEELAAEETARKAAEGGEGDGKSGIEKMVEQTTGRVTKKALEAIETSPAIQEAIEKMVLDRVNAVLGSTIVPTKVKGAFEEGPRLIRRPGQPDVAAAEVDKVDPTLQDMVSA